MHSYFINLKHQTVRRQALESSFAKHAPPDWALQRIEAVDTTQIQALGVKGRLKPTEKACYLSHCKSLAHAVQHPGHAYILEDDSVFGPNCFPSIEQAISNMAKQSESWDILLTQAMPVCAEHMVEMLRIRNECLQKNILFPANSQKMVLAGACAYVVHERAKSRLLALLDETSDLDTPVDRRYWSLTRAGVLQTRVIFPLPSSVSAQSKTSQIQSAEKAEASWLWNVAMRMLSIDRDLDLIEDEIAPLRLRPDTLVRANALLQPAQPYLETQEKRIMQRILCQLLAPGFKSLFAVR